MSQSQVSFWVPKTRFLAAVFLNVFVWSLQQHCSRFWYQTFWQAWKSRVNWKSKSLLWLLFPGLSHLTKNRWPPYTASTALHNPCSSGSLCVQVPSWDEELQPDRDSRALQQHKNRLWSKKWKQPPHQIANSWSSESGVSIPGSSWPRQTTRGWQGPRGQEGESHQLQQWKYKDRGEKEKYNDCCTFLSIKAERWCWNMCYTK